ncbi:MAG: hypothetical protein P8Z49_09790 [Acidobacteriota bacterium]
MRAGAWLVAGGGADGLEPPFAVGVPSPEAGVGAVEALSSGAGCSGEDTVSLSAACPKDPAEGCGWAGTAAGSFAAGGISPWALPSVPPKGGCSCTVLVAFCREVHQK